MSLIEKAGTMLGRSSSERTKRIDPDEFEEIESDLVRSIGQPKSEETNRHSDMSSPDTGTGEVGTSDGFEPVDDAGHEAENTSFEVVFDKQDEQYTGGKRKKQTKGFLGRLPSFLRRGFTKSKPDARSDGSPEVDGNELAQAMQAFQPESVPDTAKQSSSVGAGRSGEFLIDFARLRRFGFITPHTRRSKTSEEFRLIKRRLMQRMTLKRTRGKSDELETGLNIARKTAKKKAAENLEHVILVTSTRPSEGKSYVAINLALSIAIDEGYNVMLVDADAARPAINRVFGLSGGRKGLTDLLSDNPPSLPSVLLRERRLPLTVLGAGSAVASATDLFGGEEMTALVSDIAGRYSDRIIIFDAPPLLASTEPVVLSQHVGQIVLVIDAQTTPKNAVTAALDLLDEDASVNLVLNRSVMRGRIEQFGTYYDVYAGES